MKTIKVLLVDDNEDFVTTVSKRIQKRGLESDTALRGKVAMELVENQVPDVMVLDLKMPYLDGMEVLRHVKLTHHDLQIIILTGHASLRDRLEAISLGAFAFMEKPVKIDDLVRTIKDAYPKKHLRL